MDNRDEEDRPYNEDLDPNHQLDVEEKIASLIYDHEEVDVGELAASDIGRDILKMVLSEFRPDLMSGEKESGVIHRAFHEKLLERDRDAHHKVIDDLQRAVDSARANLGFHLGAHQRAEAENDALRKSLLELLDGHDLPHTSCKCEEFAASEPPHQCRHTRASALLTYDARVAKRPWRMGNQEHLELWEGINEYARACGGDTSADHRERFPARMEAVSRIERAIEAVVSSVSEQKIS